MSAFVVASKFTAKDAFSKVVDRMQTKTSTFARKGSNGFNRVSKSITGLNRKVSSSLSKFGALAALGGGLTLGAAISTAANDIVDFDKNISAASAKFQVFDRSEDTFKNISKEARILGATTEFTAGQAAQGFSLLGTAGFKASEAVASIPSVLDLATAAQEELSTATDVAVGGLTAFGMKSRDPLILAKNLGVVSDVLNKTVTSSGFKNLEELQTTITAAGVSFDVAGQDIFTFAAAAGKANDSIRDGSIVGTQLNMALTRLAKPVGEAQKLLSATGIVVSDSNRNFRDLFDILGDVEKVTASMGTQQKAAFLSTIFGARAFKSISALLKVGSKELRNYRDEIKGASGVTQKMAQFMRGGLFGILASMKSAVTEIGLALGDVFQVEIKNSIASITEIARNAGTWVKENKSVILSVLSLAKNIGMLMIALKAGVLIISTITAISKAWAVVNGILIAVNGSLLTATSMNTTALIAYSTTLKVVTFASKLWAAATWLVNGAFKALTANPIILAIVAVITVAILVIKNWGKIVEWVSDKWKKLGDFFSRINWVAVLRKTGAAIIKFLLFPMRLVLGLVSKIPGKIGEAAGSALGKIDSMINKVGGSQEILARVIRTPGEEDSARALSSVLAREQTQAARTEFVTRQEGQIGITLKDPTGTAEVETEGNIPFRLEPTTGGF